MQHKHFFYYLSSVNLTMRTKCACGKDFVPLRRALHGSERNRSLKDTIPKKSVEKAKKRTNFYRHTVAKTESSFLYVKFIKHEQKHNTSFLPSSM